MTNWQSGYCDEFQLQVKYRRVNDIMKSNMLKKGPKHPYTQLTHSIYLIHRGKLHISTTNPKPPSIQLNLRKPIPIPQLPMHINQSHVPGDIHTGSMPLPIRRGGPAVLAPVFALRKWWYRDIHVHRDI